ncbi:MAG TPA: S9 family peptidase [Bryobacteraceae bacterium]|nr:S9 family peptidase [Bryobacteraceae bacterium]
MVSRLCAAALVCAVPALFAKAPITHEDVWLTKRVGAPVPSPDGKWVVFPLTEPAYEEKDEKSDLWIVPADGSAPPRRLTFSKGPESGAAWSPDSRRLAFAAKREGDEANQVYVLDVAAGGEAVRVTSLSTGASSPRWRPDGKALAFTSMVYPGASDDAANQKAAAERKGRKYHARVYDGFPVRYWDRWLDDRRIHLFVQEIEGGAARDLLAGTRLASGSGFAGSSTLTGEELGQVWAPDGRSLVFAATESKNQAAYASVDTGLYQVPAEGGEPKRLTPAGGSYSKPVFSADGKALYCIWEPDGEKVYQAQRIVRFGWPGTASRTVVTAALDRSVNTFGITPDGGTIYLLAEEAGHEKLYTVAAAGGDARLAFDMSQGAYTNLAIPEKAMLLFATWESAVNPAEVVRIDPRAGRHDFLTTINRERAAAIDWQPLRHFTFTSKRGKPIHSMIALPPAFDPAKKYPLLVLMHGGPHSMWRDQFFTRWNYHLLASPGYVVLLTNYTGSTGFGEKFAQEIQFDPLSGPAEEINEAADEAIRRFPFIDSARQAAGGASYGGHLANWMQATTTRYKCLVSHAGLINLESQWGTSDTIWHREVASGGPVWEQGKVWREQNPIRFAKNFRTPILLTIGERDYRVPLNQTLENWSVLQRLRIPSRLVVFEEANHWIAKGEDSRFFYQEVLAWLAKHL